MGALSPRFLVSAAPGRFAWGGMTRPFTKMQGCGNDYVVVDAIHHPVADPASLARTSCDRRRGIGADGLLLALASEQADIRMRMFNPDGSEAEMCGNGLRCLAVFVGAQGLVPDPRQMRVETGAGILLVRVDPDAPADERVSVDMGRAAPLFDGPRIQRADIEVEREVVSFVPVSMGNPHAVVFVDDVEASAFERLGPAIERHPRFPNRTNVEFVEVSSRRELRQRTWERGVGETEACGTGACAVAVAAALEGHTDREVLIHLRGGDLRVRLDDEDHVHLTGPAVVVFEGQWP